MDLKQHYLYLFESYRQVFFHKGIAVQLELCNDEKEKIAQLFKGEDGYWIIINIQKLQDDEQFLQIMEIYRRSLLLGTLSIETSRLKIRRIMNSDTFAIHRLVTHPQIVECNGYDGQRIHQYFGQYLNNLISNPCEYGIELIEKKELVGMISLRPIDTRGVPTIEIGYNIFPADWRRGYASEALSSVIKSIFDELRFEMIVAGVFDDNVAVPDCCEN